MQKRPEYTRIKLRELRKETYGKDSFKGKKVLTKAEKWELKKEKEEKMKNLFKLFDIIKKM